MPKNPAFDFQFYQPQKDLLASLSAEVISIHGQNVEWIANPYTNVDALYREDRMPDLGPSKTIVVMLDNPEGGIDGDAIFSKFGFMNQQTISILIAVNEWKEVFDTHRPLEGDIFYLPFQDEFGPADFFKITFVDKNDAVGYFPLGRHHVFKCSAEKWAYSSENFANTGVDEIDIQLPDWSNDVTVNPTMANEVAKVNTEVQTISDTFVNWNETNPFGRS
jgi:hypothetical protein